MQSIELLSFSEKSASEALRHIPEKNDIHFAKGNLFWLGAVDSADKQRIQSFSELCEQGRFEEAGQYADISQGCVYGILAGRTGGIGYRLFLLEIGPSPHATQRCLWTKVFDHLVVTGKHGPVKAIDLDASLSLKDILRNAFR